MSMLYKINYIFNRKQKIRLIQLNVLIAIGALFELLGVSAILPFINTVLEPSSIRTTSYLSFFYNSLGFNSSIDFMVFIGICLIIVYIIKNLYIAIMYDAQYRFIYHNQCRISSKLLDSYLQENYLFHLKHNSAELLRNVNYDVTVFFLLLLAVLQLITEISVCLVLVVFLLIMDFAITVGVTILLTIFVLGFMKIFRVRLKEMGLKSRNYQAEMNKWMLQAMGGIKEIKVMNIEDFFSSQYRKAYYLYAESQRKYSLLGILPKPVLEMFSVTGLLIVIIIRLLSDIEIDNFIPTLSVFAVAAFRMLPSFNRITNSMNTVMFNRTAVDKIYHDLKQAEKYLNEPVIPEDSGMNFENEIRLENVSFTYPEAELPILENANLKIRKNESVAFIGASGAGKTTLADLILGVLIPQSGKVSVDGKNIQENMNSWHKKIGYIPQSIYIMDDTLRNNIAFGVQEKLIDDNRIWRALEKAQLKKFVKTLERGLDTNIGEGGMRLSGGQKQRVGIARVLYNDPEVLVLDEATSALDTETESALMDAIDSFSGEKTLIIIAHRLSTVKNCDTIYKIENCKIKESKIGITGS